MKGKFNICRCSGGKQDTMKVDLIDAESGIYFASFETDLESFMKALTASAHMPMEYDLLAQKHQKSLGKKHVCERHDVVIPKDYPFNQEEFKEVARTASKHLEVDGWKVDDYSLQSNSHNIKRNKNGETVLSVSRYKYV